MPFARIDIGINRSPLQVIIDHDTNEIIIRYIDSRGFAKRITTRTTRPTEAQMMLTELLNVIDAENVSLCYRADGVVHEIDEW